MQHFGPDYYRKGNDCGGADAADASDAPASESNDKPTCVGSAPLKSKVASRIKPIGLFFKRYRGQLVVLAMIFLFGISCFYSLQEPETDNASRTNSTSTASRYQADKKASSASKSADAEPSATEEGSTAKNSND